MIPSPPSPLVAGLAAIPVAAGALAIGALVADAVLGRRLDRVSRWGLALPGFGAFVVLLMLTHMASGGRLLASPWLTRGWVAAVVAALVVVSRRRRGRDGEPAPEGWWVAVALAGMSLAVWCTPVFRLMPLDYVGDTTWHAGWSSQLLNGETTPASVITGSIPNYYPWLFHAFTATLARFTPGETTFHALAPLQLTLAAGTALTLFALGREITGRWITGAWASVLGAISGGFGFVMLRGLDLIVEPRADRGLAAIRYGSDLLFKRSYHIGFTNLAPPLPRDVALAMLLGFLVLLVAGLRRDDGRLMIASGVALGLAGLAGGEALFVGGGVAILLALLPVGVRPLAVVLRVLLPAAIVYAIWLVPIVASYLRLGGFQNITDVGPVEFSFPQVLMAWGLATPMALLGARAWLRSARTEPGSRVILYILLAAGALAFVAVGIPGRLGEAFATLGRRHRYWPLVHLGLCLIGAMGGTWLVDRLRARRGLAIGMCGALLAVAIVSPVVASLALPRNVRTPDALVPAMRGEPDAILNALRGPEGKRCSFAVPQGSRQALVWSFTGHRLVLANWKIHFVRNRARIRWGGIYDTIPDDVERRRANRALTEGTLPRDRWRSLARRYGVSAVVVPEEHAGRAAFAGLRQERVDDPKRPVRVVWLEPCR